MPRMTKRAMRELLADVCRKELSRSEGGEQDELQASRAEALNYYFANPRGDEVEGRSQVISTDVADCTNATLAMMRDMLIREAEVSIDPDGDDDEVQARVEADVLNDVLMKDNNGEKEILAAVRDALLLKNGCLKVHVDEHSQVDKLDVSGASDEQLAMVQMTLTDGQTAEVDDGTLTVTTVTRRFEVRAVPIENVSYQASYSGRLQDIRFFAERIFYTRSELIDMGAKKADIWEIPPWTNTDHQAGQVRNVSYQPGSDAETKDQDILECHECYVLVDLDGDGVSERYMVLLAGDSTVVRYEPADLIPYSMGSPFLVPHRLTGESLFDRLKQTQDVNTALQRQLLDNVAVINNGRYAYDPGQTAEEDVLNPVAGGGIRARNPAQSVVPIPIPDVTSGILIGLEYQRKLRTEKVGAALDMASAEAQLVNKSATAASIEKGNQELVSSMIAANLASTLLRDLYRILHEMLRRYAIKPYNVRVSGQATQVRPTEWQERSRFIVRCGMSPTERGQLQMALGQHIQLQAQAMGSGMDGILADPNTIYRASTEWLRLYGVEAPERLVIDPSSPQAQQAAQAKAEQSQQMQQMQAQVAQMQLQMEQAKLAEEARQHDAEIRHKYYDTDMDAEIAEAKIAGQGVIDLEKQRMSNETKRDSSAERSAPGTGGAT